MKISLLRQLEIVAAILSLAGIWLVGHGEPVNGWILSAVGAVFWVGIGVHIRLFFMAGLNVFLFIFALDALLLLRLNGAI